MVDNPPVPTTPPDPPEESGPIEGSDEWKVVQGIKDKRREFGAGVAFPTGNKIRHFVLEFRFKEKLNEADAEGSTLNLHGLHREFVETLMDNTGEAQLIPTAKDKKNSTTTTPHPMININNFPMSDRLHKLFFHRTIYYDKYNKRTVVRIFHAVLMKETVFAIKQKMFEWLKQKHLWMLAGELDSVETSGIGWMLGAHPHLVFTPDIADRMNFLISRLSKTLIEEKVALHGSVEDLEKLPQLFVNPRDQGFGAPPGRVQTKAVTLSCVINRTRLMKDLISSIPKPDLPYMYIPIGLPTMEGPEVYMKLICINNDRQNEVQGINVKGFSDGLFSCYTDDTKKQTVMDYFMGQPSIASVQRTLQTAENGKFIFIVYTAGYNEAKDLIQEFCETKFKLIYNTQQQRDDYRVSVKSHPHLVTAALPGGATAEHGKYLVEMLKQEETQKGQQYATTSGSTWASKVKPKFTFDPSSEHPNATSAKTATATTVVATGHGSIGSNNSSSTLAPTAPLNSSGQTVVSQDLSSIVSQMQSMQSEQSKVLQSLFEKQDKQARRQAKAQRKATAAAVRANENMMSMVVEMFRELRGGTTNKKKSPKNKKKSTQDKKKKKKKKLGRDPKQNKRSNEDVATTTKQDTSSNKKKAMVAYIATENNEEQKASHNDDALGAAGLNEQDEIELNSGDDDIGSAAYDESDEDSANGSGEEDDYDTADEYDEEDEEEEDDNDDDSSDGCSDSDDESDDSSDDSTATPPSRNQKKKQSPKKERSTLEAQHAVVSTEVAPPASSTSAVAAAEGYHDAGRLDKYFTPATRPTRKKRMTTVEARNHSKASIAARKQELSDRAERKIALRVLETNKRVPDPDQTPMAIDDTPCPGPTTPPSKRERTRQRSPGGTPDNDQKLQRTGTAPLQPSTNDEIARALDYLSNEEATTQEESMELAGLAGQPI
jgi:hypothetical protein